MGSDWFGNASLATKYGIVIGGLIFITFFVAFIKVSLNRRKLKQHTAALKAAEEARVEHTETVPIVEYGEGDLFGVRAIQKGYYGGVTQSPDLSRPETPVRSRKSLVRSILSRLSLARLSRVPSEIDPESKADISPVPPTLTTGPPSRNSTIEPTVTALFTSLDQIDEHAPLPHRPHASPYAQGSPSTTGPSSAIRSVSLVEAELSNQPKAASIAPSVPESLSEISLPMRKRAATNASEISVKSTASSKSRGGSPFFKGEHGRTRSRSLASQTRLRSVSNADSPAAVEETPQLPALILPQISIAAADVATPQSSETEEQTGLQDPPPDPAKFEKHPISQDVPPVPDLPPVQLSERIQEKINAARKLISTVNDPESPSLLSDRIQQKTMSAKELIMSVDTPTDRSRRSTTHSIASTVANSVFTPALSRHSPGFGPSTMSEFSFDSAEDGDLPTPRESFKIRTHTRMHDFDIPAMPIPLSFPVSRNSFVTRSSNLSRSRTLDSQKDNCEIPREESVVSEVSEIECSPKRPTFSPQAESGVISPVDSPIKQNFATQQSPFFQDFPTPTELVFDPTNQVFAKPLRLLQLEENLEQAFPSPIEPYWPQSPQPAHIRNGQQAQTPKATTPPTAASDSQGQEPRRLTIDALDDVYDTYWSIMATNGRAKRGMYEDGPSPTAMMIGPPTSRAGRPAFRPKLNNTRRAPSSNYQSRWKQTASPSSVRALPVQNMDQGTVRSRP